MHTQHSLANSTRILVQISCEIILSTLGARAEIWWKIMFGYIVSEVDTKRVKAKSTLVDFKLRM